MNDLVKINLVRRIIMIDKLSTYAKSLIYIVIIIGILELIIPNGKNKKYIKVVMGMFVIFSIISPVVGKRINVNEEIIEKYMNSSTSQKNKASENDENLKTIFKSKVKENVEAYLSSKGYECKNIIVKEENYNISQICINGISKNEKNAINKIEINIKDTSSKKKDEVNNEEKNKIIEYIAKNYEINKENILIN